MILSSADRCTSHSCSMGGGSAKYSRLDLQNLRVQQRVHVQFTWLICRWKLHRASVIVCACVCLCEIWKQYCCGTLISPDMFPISSTAERSLFTNLDQRSFILAHYNPPPFSIFPSLSLSVRLSLSQLVDVLAITLPIYTAMGRGGNERRESRRSTQSLGALFPRACLFFLIAKCFLQLVHVTPAWEALVDKEV